MNNTEGQMHEALCEVLHPMNSAGGGNYITRMMFKVDSKLHAEFLLGPYISSNPVIGTGISNLKQGQTVSVEWQDLAGNRGQASAGI